MSVPLPVKDPNETPSYGGLKPSISRASSVLIGRSDPAPKVEYKKFHTDVKELIPQLLGYYGRAMQNHRRVSMTFRSAICACVIVRFRGISITV